MPKANTPKTDRGWSTRAILALALIAALAVLALGLLQPTGIAELFARLLSGVGSSGEQDPEQQAYEAILDGLGQPETAAPRSLDALSLVEAFSQYPFADTYEHLYTVTYTDGQRSTTRCVSLTRAGEAYRILLFNGSKMAPGELLLSAEGDEETLQVRDTMGNQHLYLKGEDFPLSSVAMLPDTDTFCALLRDYEADPDTSPLSSCSAVVTDAPQGRMLTLTFVERDTGREEVYQYLLDYGILYSATSTQDGLTYYTLTTISFTMEEEISADE